jgi:bifunctional DNA-binding transcriptional regulator/antitoxin component of YhaV-PrlF toxin-antitoxin module
MTSTIKLTGKRQATFPKALCDELDLKPGDAIRLDKRTLHGESVYCIRAVKRDETPSWFGVFNAYAEGRAHGMTAIRESIAKGRKRELERRYGKVRS